jgi:hypothetical protein
MGAQLPLSVKVSGRPLSVIVDAAFALSPLGLLTTMRLAQYERVWLPRALWTMLDNDTLYRQSPQRMGGDWLPADRRKELLAGMAAELVPWRRAWHYGRLAAQVHWIGDAQYESCLPDRTDALLLPRFEACCAAFDARRAERQIRPLSALDECARDAVALAGALQPEPVVILTLGARDGAEPPLCAFLAAIGITAQPLPASLAPRLCDLGLAEAVLPLAAASEPATALHVLAPGVLSMPEPRAEGDWSLEETDEQGELLRAYAWDGARALWQTVAAP